MTSILVGSLRDPSAPTVAEINAMDDLTHYFKGETVCDNNPRFTFNSGGFVPPRVSVSDLWKVFPELKQGTPEEFVRNVQQAAQFSRQQDAFHVLRENFKSEALGVVLDSFPVVTLDISDEGDSDSTPIFNGGGDSD